MHRSSRADKMHGPTATAVVDNLQQIAHDTRHRPGVVRGHGRRTAEAANVRANDPEGGTDNGKPLPPRLARFAEAVHRASSRVPVDRAG